MARSGLGVEGARPIVIAADPGGLQFSHHGIVIEFVNQGPHRMTGPSKPRGVYAPAPEVIESMACIGHCATITNIMLEEGIRMSGSDGPIIDLDVDTEAHRTVDMPVLVERR
jgi:hypothetical protein